MACMSLWCVFDVTQLKVLHYLRNLQQLKRIPFSSLCVGEVEWWYSVFSPSYLWRFLQLSHQGIEVVNSLPLSPWLLYFSSSAARLVSSGIWTEKQEATDHTFSSWWVSELVASWHTGHACVYFLLGRKLFLRSRNKDLAEERLPKLFQYTQYENMALSVSYIAFSASNSCSSSFILCLLCTYCIKFFYSPAGTYLVYPNTSHSVHICWSSFDLVSLIIQHCDMRWLPIQVSW